MQLGTAQSTMSITLSSVRPKCLACFVQSIQPRQHGDGQNDAVPVNSVADVNGHRIGIQLPVPKQPREADRHIFQCAHSRIHPFFL